MAGTAYTLFLSWVILSPVVQAEQNCQGDDCPATVNSLLQSGRKAVSFADDAEAQQSDCVDDDSDEAKARRIELATRRRRVNPAYMPLDGSCEYLGGGDSYSSVNGKTVKDAGCNNITGSMAGFCPRQNNCLFVGGLKDDGTMGGLATSFDASGIITEMRKSCSYTCGVCRMGCRRRRDIKGKGDSRCGQCRRRNEKGPAVPCDGSLAQVKDALKDDDNENDGHDDHEDARAEASLWDIAVPSAKGKGKAGCKRCLLNGQCRDISVEKCNLNSGTWKR